jgi:hypothetical protein
VWLLQAAAMPAEEEPTAAGAPARWRAEQCAASPSSSSSDPAAAQPRLVRWLSYKKSAQQRRALRNPNSTAPTYGSASARRIFRYFGWQETRADDWDLLWTGISQYSLLQKHGLFSAPSESQAHNHCFGTGLLAGNKQSLVRRHNHMVDVFGSHGWSHLPQTFELPDDYHELIEAMEQQIDVSTAADGSGSRKVGGGNGNGTQSPPTPPPPPPLWILKPTLGARGEGIELLRSASEVPRRGGAQAAAVAPAHIVVHAADLAEIPWRHTCVLRTELRIAAVQTTRCSATSPMRETRAVLPPPCHTLHPQRTVKAANRT